MKIRVTDVPRCKECTYKQVTQKEYKGNVYLEYTCMYNGDNRIINGDLKTSPMWCFKRKRKANKD